MITEKNFKMDVHEGIMMKQKKNDEIPEKHILKLA